MQQILLEIKALREAMLMPTLMPIMPSLTPMPTLILILILTLTPSVEKLKPIAKYISA